MEGILFIPPDRGTIIGRALWKSRFVVVGAARDAKDKLPNHASKSSAAQAAQSARTASSRGPAVMPPEFMFLSIYKTKDDTDPVQQHAISSITDCQVQMIAHRKQGPVLPTLVVSVSPDPVTDKLRKRRSSRTAGLTTTKDTMPSTLWFRPGEDSHHSHKHILQEWCRFIQLLMQQLGTATAVTSVPSVTSVTTPATPAASAAASTTATVPVSASASAPASAPASAAPSGVSSMATNSAGPLSPITPATPTFSNPFSATRHRDTSDASLHKQQSNNIRTDSDHHSIWPGGTKKQANQVTHGRDRERPTAPSESPSLRSRRSDLSHTSSNIAPHALPPPNGFVMPMPMFPYRPAELPSPATTVAESPAESDSWAQTQGVSSSVSSPIRGRDSIGSQPTQIPSKLGMTSTTAGPALASGSPPVPRETILDRAFQMRFIPGSGREVPGEEKLSSLARFDALMREAEERKRMRQTIAGPYVPPLTRSSTGTTSRTPVEPRSGWDLDEDSEEDDEEDEAEEEEDSEDDLDEIKKVEEAEDDEGEDENEGSDAVSDGDSLRAEWSQVKEEALNARAHQLDPAIRMTPKTLRALDFITNRRSAGGTLESAGANRRPISRTGTFSGDYDPQTLQMLNSGCNPSSAQQQQPQQQQQLLRPQTGYARNRPAIAQRTHSQPQLAPLNIGSFTYMGKRYASHVSPTEHVTSPLSPRSPPSVFQATSPASDDFPLIPTSSRLHRSVTSAATTPTTAAFSGNLTPLDQRQLASSTKRLSFSEFTKRISGGNSRTAADNGSTSTLSGPGGSGPASPVPGQALSRYTVPPPPPPPADRCVWRGSVGVLGNEGGFL